jgi:HPt (histidine-containing phosphotransfer) domain-containing protein
MSAPAVVDEATFRALEETAGPEFVAELVGTFLEEAPRMLQDLQGAFAAADADRFRRAAHSLKSNALTFGALALAAQAKSLELAGIAAAKAQGGDPVGQLAAEYARCAAALKAMAHA